MGVPFIFVKMVFWRIPISSNKAITIDSFLATFITTTVSFFSDEGRHYNNLRQTQAFLSMPPVLICSISTPIHHAKFLWGWWILSFKYNDSILTVLGRLLNYGEIT